MSELENIVLDPTVPNLASESVQNLIPPKKKFPFLLYISLILLSVVSVISIYLFLQVRQLTLEKLTPSPTPTPSPSADPTEGWQTYTYQDITFKYPIDWNITTDDMIAVQPPYKGDQEEYPAITFFAIDNPKNLTVQEYDEQVSKEGMDPALYSAFIGESEVIAKAKSFNGIESYTLNDQNCEPLGCDKFSFVLNKKIYVIQNVFDHQTLPMEGSVDDKEDMRIVFNQILSTLKFTDSEKSNLPKKYYLSSGKFFDTRPYPTELTSLKDTDLTGFSCSDKYTKRENNEYVFRKYGSGEGAGYEDTNITDKPVLEYLQANGADEAVVCKTDTGRTLLSYGIFGKGGGVGSATYYGYLEGNNPSVATIPTENGPYFTCGTILAITKSNTLYVECLSGDGGFGSKSLYRVGLYKAYTSDLLLKCTTTMQDESSTPKITCGTTQ